MSLFNIFKSQLSSVIEWEEQNNSILWYKHPSERDEIIHASKLILAPSQGCILVYEGKIVDILEQEGVYNLQTDNHPFITTLMNLRQNFESEHKLYIYFYQRAILHHQAWGTATPVKYMDPVYQIPVELGINGVFAFRIADIKYVYENIVTNQKIYKTESLREIIVDKIPTEITSYLAKVKYSFQELDENLVNIAQELQIRLNEDFKSLGLEILDFKIIGSQFDQATNDRISTIADMNIDVQAATLAGLSYAELEKLKALRDAARNEGAVTSIGAQFAVGTEISNLLKSHTKEPSQSTNITEDFADKLRKINILLKEQIITETEYEELKKQILNKL